VSKVWVHSEGFVGLSIDFFFLVLLWQATCRKVPNSTLPKGVFGSNKEPRSVNSGTVIGSAIAMRTLFKDLSDILQEPERQSQGDQGDSSANSILPAIG
jgi:hypothetical protein